MKKQRKPSQLGIGFFAVAASALLLGFLPAQARAEVVCGPNLVDPTGDFDGDGLTNQVECSPITLVGTGRLITLDPNTPDFFVILQRSTPSLLPADPFVFISKPLAQGGLHRTPRLVNLNETTNQRVAGAKVVKVTESQDLNGDTLGFADAGQDLVVVWTARIRRHIINVYGAAGISEANIPATVFTDYINHTTAQEVAHLLSLKTTCDPRWGPGCHDKDGAAVVMERSVNYTTKGGRVTFYIGVNFTAADQNGAIPPQ